LQTDGDAGNGGAGSKKEVDEKRETLHNLISLLLTNKTICRQVARRSSKQVL
jgi:hypothetical protein